MEKRINLITTLLYAALTLYTVGAGFYVVNQFPHSPQELVSVGLTIFAVVTITLFSGLFLVDHMRMSKKHK